MDTPLKEYTILHDTDKNPLLLALSDAEELTDAEYRFVYDIVTPARRARADRFLRRADSCRSLLGEALLYYIVKKRMGVTLDEVTIRCNEFGRPEIAAAPFSYSISHSGSWVCCAVDAAPCGADVEKIHTADLKIAERFFCPEEAAFIGSAEGEIARRERFFTHWVLKESYIKAIGRGLHCPLDSFECRRSTTGAGWDLVRHDSALPPLFLSMITLPNAAYRCAVCTQEQHSGIPLQVMPAAAFVEMLSSL